MKIKTTDSGTVRYSIGDFEVVDKSATAKDGAGCVYFRHRCVGTNNGALLYPEVRENRCWNCGSLDLPKELLTIYLLMRDKNGPA